jgi:hypothetical protein
MNTKNSKYFSKKMVLKRQKEEMLQFSQYSMNDRGQI